MDCRRRIDPGPLRPLLSELAAFFEARGVEAWATGGFLRDELLGRPAHDIDITVSGDPLALGPALADALSGHYFALREERGQARIRIPGQGVHIDLMPLRGAIEDDLRLRDYSIDALAAPLGDVARGEFEVIDPTGGLADLEAGVVRMTGEEAFADDALRLLRGPRIATELGFTIELETVEAIRRRAASVTEAAPERQRDEIVRVFSTDRAAEGLRLLDRLGLFAHVLPEMEVCRGVEQPKEHHYDVLGHSFAAVEILDALMCEEAPATPQARELWSELWTALAAFGGVREYFRDEVVQATTRRALLKFCALLHDVGKPQTKSFEENGRMRFFGHGEAGARVAEDAMRRLRFSSREVDIVARMIEAHLRPIQLGEQGAPSRRAIYKFFRDTGEAGIETLFLSLADHLATVGPRVSLEGFRSHLALTSYILRMRFEERGVVSPPKLIAGEDLMSAFGLEPGPLLGELLEAIREAQAAGEVSTMEQALELARKRLR